MYKYITEEVINPTKPIKEYSLCSQKGLKGKSHAVRIKPDGALKKQKNKKGTTYQWETDKTLNHFPYDIIVKIDGKWIVKNELKGTVPYRYKDELRKQKVYHTPNGYMTQAVYNKYLKNLSKGVKS